MESLGLWPHPFSLCLRLHTAFTPCVSVPSYRVLTRTPVIGLSATLLQCKLIRTQFICKDPTSNSTYSHMLCGREFSGGHYSIHDNSEKKFLVVWDISDTHLGQLLSQSRTYPKQYKHGGITTTVQSTAYLVWAPSEDTRSRQRGAGTEAGALPTPSRGGKSNSRAPPQGQGIQDHPSPQLWRPLFLALE